MESSFSILPYCAILLAVRLTTLRKLLAVSLAISFCCSCNAEQPSQPMKLPSGRIVKVLGILRINFAQEPPALMLKYETDLKVGDKDALRKEVDEIFAVFKLDAENGQFRSAIVSANEKATGFILKKSNAYNFVYEKRADGQWHYLEDDKAK